MSKPQTTQRTGGQAGLGDKGRGSAPASRLEFLDALINPNVHDDVVGHLGTGFYSESEQWQQIASFRKGMYGEAVFSAALSERAVNETIQELGRHGWEWYDPNDNDYREERGMDPDDCDARESPRKKIHEHGERIWEKLGLQRDYADEEEDELSYSKEQLKAMLEFGGVADWIPPHYRMMEARHEASKSRDARTQDNVTGSRSHKSVEHEGPSGNKKRFMDRRQNP